MKVRGRFRTATALLFACTILAACSSGSDDTSAASDTSASPSDDTSTLGPVAPDRTAAFACTASEEWIAVPADFSAELMARDLGVSADQVAAGSFGPATCDQPISADAILVGKAPIVSVSGEGSKCLVIGTMQEPLPDGTVPPQPQPGDTTEDILAVCAAQAV